MVTLLMACGFMGLWGRSHFSKHSIDLPCGKGVTYHAKLTPSGIETSKTQQFELEDNQQFRLVENRIVIVAIENEVVIEDAHIETPVLPSDTECTKIIGAATIICESEPMVLSHWCFITPFTLISAFLLLSKLRPSTPKKTPEPIAPKLD